MTLPFQLPHAYIFFESLSHPPKERSNLLDLSYDMAFDLFTVIGIINYQTI